MTQAPTLPTRKGQFTGWHMLAVMVAFFGVIVSVNFYMAFSAINSWTGLVVENSYVASQQFNTKLANAKAQTAMGWQGGLAYENRTLVFTLHGPDNAPLPVQTVNIALSRPIGVTGDQSVTLTAASGGTYTAPLDLDAGVWNAQIVASFTDQPDYEHHARLVIGTQK